MRYFTPALFIMLIGVELVATLAARADSAPLPVAIAWASSFHGHLAYRAHDALDPSQLITGTLDVSTSGWSLDEESATTQAHASNQYSWLRAGGRTMLFDDPFDVDAIANPWAVLLGASSGAQILADPGGSSWTTSTGARMYVNADRTELTGMVDTRSENGASFVFSNWTVVSGMPMPQSVVRLRGGVAVAAFVIGDYRLDSASGQPVVEHPAGAAGHPVAASAIVPGPAGTSSSPWRPFTILCALLVAALGLVAWMRRDALVDRLAQRVASDPRAWRHEGHNLFVSPEGVMRFEGRPYRVGSRFYNRTVVVQSSPLFIKVTAPGESRTVILARKFPLPASFAPARRSATGFTLVEALASSVLFATVIVAVVVPTLIVLAHADHLAAQRQLALQLASNALADEEAGLAYGPTIKDESTRSVLGGMQLIETVSATTIAGLHMLTLEVTDAGGHSLAKIVTEIGPPVLQPGKPLPAPTASSRS